MALPTKKQLRDKLGIRGTALELLHLLMRWEPNAKLYSDDGSKMIYKTNPELCEELDRSRRAIIYARKELRARGWVRITVNLSERRSYFIILWDRLGPALGLTVQPLHPQRCNHCTPTVQKVHPNGAESAPLAPIISSSTTSTTSKDNPLTPSNNLFGDDLPEKQNQYIPSEYEKKILVVLKGIYKYPFDRDDDVKTIRTLAAKYPGVDIEACAMKMAAEYTDVRITKKSRPRRKLMTYVSNAFKWGTDQLPEKPRSMTPPKSPLAEGRGYAAPPEAEPGRFVDMAKRKGKKK